MLGGWFGAAPNREDEYEEARPVPRPPATRVVARHVGYRAELVLTCIEPEMRFCLPGPPALLRWGSIVSELVIGWGVCERANVRMRLDHAPARMTWATDSAEPFTCTFHTHSTPEILFKHELEQETRDTLRLVALSAANMLPSSETKQVDAARSRFLFASNIAGSVLSDGSGEQLRAMFFIKAVTLAIETI